MSIESCVRNVMEEAGVTEGDAIEAMQQMLQEKDLLTAETNLDKVEFDLERIAEGVGNKERESAAKARRRALQNIILAHKLDGHIKELRSQGVKGYKKPLLAVLRGIHWGITGSRQSVAGHGAALEARWNGMLSKRLNERPHIWKLMDKDPLFLDDVVVEMNALDTTPLPTITGNTDARFLAEVLREVADVSYNRVQIAGGEVSLRKNWVPQRHDAGKMLKAGREEWVKFLIHQDVLDMEKTFGNLNPELIPDVLDEMYYRIKDGEDVDSLQGWDVNDRGPANLANQLAQKKRGLHFKDSTAWLQYHKEFGRGNVFTAVIEHIRANARDAALMEYFGSNPQAFMERFIQRVKNQIKTDPSLSERQKDIARKELPDNLNSPFNALGRNWGVLTGAADRYVPSQFVVAGMHLEVSKWPRVARAITNMGKLGMAVLTSVTDLGTSVAQLRHEGMHPLEGAYKMVTGVFKGKTPKEKVEIANLLGVALDAQLYDIHARFMAEDAPLGGLAKAERFFFKVSLLTPWTERVRQTFALVSSAHMATQSKSQWADLNDWFRLSLEKHGMGEREWKIIQAMETKGADGREYITPDAIAHLSDDVIREYAEPDILKLALHVQEEVDARSMSSGDAAKIIAKRRAVIQSKARRNIQDKLSAYFLDETNNGVIQPGVETKAIQTGGIPAGTVWGEVIRCIMQFKSFPIAFGQKQFYGHLKGARGGKVDKGGLAQLIAYSTVLGLAAGAAKDVSKGREPRSLTDPATWGSAFMQGGGAGIYGDFLFKSYDRFGSSPMKTLEGPVFNSTDDLVKMVSNTVHGNPPSAARAMHWGMNNMPFVNLFYTRQALDYLVLYNFQEMASPGYLRRMERRLKKEHGQEMISPPSTHIKRGGGWR